jgi:hypothetical protein
MTATTASAEVPKARASAQVWAGRVMSGLFVAFMLMDMSMKLMRMPQVEEYGQKLGLPPGSGFGLGVMELISTALYLVPRTAVLGAVLIAAYMGGTVIVHWMHADPLFSHALFGVYLAVFAWGGLWLRDPRLRALFPLRAP